MTKTGRCTRLSRRPSAAALRLVPFQRGAGSQETNRPRHRMFSNTRRRLRPAADPEGLPIEHFNKLRSGINVRDGEWLGDEWLGEMGDIKGRSRNTTARAAADGQVEVLSAQQFLERVSNDPALARDLILRLSIRLRRIEGKIAGDLLPFAHDRSPDGAGQPAPGAAIAEDTRISLIAQSDALRARIGASAIRVTKLPFLAGRIPVAGEPKPSRLASHKPLQRSFAEYSWALLICIDLPARGLMTFSCLFECPSCIGWICSTVAFHIVAAERVLEFKEEHEHGQLLRVREASTVGQVFPDILSCCGEPWTGSQGPQRRASGRQTRSG
jgi:CRP-like cAMP-binding protein